MKKLLWSLFFLAAFSGGFWTFAWFQVQIEPGQAAVAVSKTSGVHPQVLEPGHPAWLWEALFPTNLTLFVFPNLPRESRITLAGRLAGGEFYAALLNRPGVFDWSLELQLVYRPRNDRLPDLVRAGGLRPEHWESYWNQQEGLWRETLNATLNAAAGAPGPLDPTDLGRQLTAALRDRWTDVEAEVRVLQSQWPDTALYERLRAEVLQSRLLTEDLSTRLRQAADQRLEEQRLAWLNQLSQVLQSSQGPQAQNTR